MKNHIRARASEHFFKISSTAFKITKFCQNFFYNFVKFVKSLFSKLHVKIFSEFSQIFKKNEQNFFSQNFQFFQNFVNLKKNYVRVIEHSSICTYR